MKSQRKNFYQSSLLHCKVFDIYNIKYFLELELRMMMISFYSFSFFQVADDGGEPFSPSMKKF